MSSDRSEVDSLTPVEAKLEELKTSGSLEIDQTDKSDEVVDFLFYVIQLARKKTTSHKLPDTTKIKWCRTAVDASKTLLFSGVLDKKAKRKLSGFEALFLSVIKEKNGGDSLSDEQDRLAME